MKGEDWMITNKKKMHFMMKLLSYVFMLYFNFALVKKII